MDVLTLYEEIDKTKVSWLLEQEVIHENDEEDVRLKLKSILKALKKDKKLKVVYRTSKDFKKHDYGRLFGYHINNKSYVYGCLGSLPRTIRGYLADDNYIDIDVKRCHWYILKYLIEKNDDFNIKNINEFIHNYDEIIKKIMENGNFEINKQFSSYHTNVDKIKELLFSILNTQPSYLSAEKQEILEMDTKFQKLHNQIYNVLLPSLKLENAELVELINKGFDKNEKNKDGAILSLILQNYERKLIMDIVDYFKTNDYTIGTIIHDGFLMKKSNNFTDDFLEECEKYIKDKYNGFEIKLVIKPFIKCDIPDIPENYKEEEEIHTDYLQLCEKLIAYTMEHKIRKDDEGNIYKRSPKNKLHYEIAYGIDGYKKLIEEVFEGDRLFNSNPAHYQNIVNFIKNRNLKEFSNVETDKDLMGFNNCVLNLRTLEITKLEDINDNDNRVVRHFIDKPLDITKLQTEKFESILMYQLQDKEALEWYYILFGRLFFGPRNDSLQVMTFIKGVANMGKSVQAEIAVACFKPNTIGTLQSNQEQVFGLESLIDKECIVIGDMSEDMKSIINVDLFKAMTSGESVNIPQKNKKAITSFWNICCFACSNYYPNYEDKGGAISKRIAIFEFCNPIENPDSSIKDYIIENELPSIIYMACKKYKEFLDKGINKTFNDIRPDYFVKTNEEYSRYINVVYQFLTKPDSIDNNGNIYKIEFGDDYETTFNEFQNQFKNWCKYNNIKNNKIKPDDSTFSIMKLKKEVINMCKSCNNIHKRDCCDNYNRTNKTTRVIIRGLRFNKMLIE